MLKYHQRRALLVVVASILLSQVAVVIAYKLQSLHTPTPPARSDPHATRRGVLQNVVAAATTVALPWTLLPSNALALPDDDDDGGDLSSVYFGVGCFWHIQHELVLAERKLLNRNDAQLSAMTGYAGGAATGKDNRVCYHNMLSQADYGRLGHAEVVQLMLPTDKIVDFGKVFFSTFNPRTKDRVDPMDRGPEYRSLMGLPGGTSHPSYSGLEAAAQDVGLKLQPGKGNDPDTLGKQIVYVMDTQRFPFYQAEVYHQFHNDFQDKAYPREYNGIADQALQDGRIRTTGCPDRV